MDKKFLHKILISTLFIGIFLSVMHNKVNANCSEPNGSYKDTCENRTVTFNEKKNKCTVKAKCKFDDNTRYIDVFNCGHTKVNNHYAYNYCNAHWDWDANKPAPKLKNKDGWLKPE